MSELKPTNDRRQAAARWRTMLFAVALALVGAAGAAAARVPPSEDPFYQYTGSTPLQNIAPGTVLKTRTVPYHVIGFPLPIKTTQLLYRSTGSLGQPTVNVTSVIRPLLYLGRPKVVAYQSFYDSLNPEDEPSYAISGGLTLGGLIPNLEHALIAPLLSQGYSFVIADTEGQQANFAAGREYGMTTLDSLRAAYASPQVGLPGDAKAVMIGYSGGAIATEWAAELAPSYAPDVDRRIIGSSMGGVFVHPMHNLHYVDGTPIWAGVLPMAIIGLTRAYGADLTPYLNDYGKALVTKQQQASIINSLGQYPGLTWAKMAKPEYQDPEQVPVFVELTNDLIMGTGGRPSAPLHIVQGAGGELEGSLGNKPGIGRGDGVMIAGDVRSLARAHCARGVAVQYDQQEVLSHIPGGVAWLPKSLIWINDRFAGRPAPQNCAQIPAGNSLAPTPRP